MKLEIPFFVGNPGCHPPHPWRAAGCLCVCRISARCPFGEAWAPKNTPKVVQMHQNSPQATSPGGARGCPGDPKAGIGRPKTLPKSSMHQNMSTSNQPWASVDGQLIQKL
eukprot:gene18180-biopygen3916